MRRYPGLQDIPPEQHLRLVKDIFSTVTERYDFLNHSLSLYQDVLWRRFAAKEIRPRKIFRLLDVATGTADLAIEVACRHSACSVIALDLMGEMTAIAAEKLRKRNLLHRVRLLRADALDLPFPSATFDVASIAFGIRNIPEKIKALQEIGRVVAPGGMVVVLEMTRPRNRIFFRFYLFYLQTLMPLVARVFSPNPSAYQYLAESILRFPSPSDFSDMMRKAGLSSIETYSLTLGIAHLFVGTK